LWRLFVGSETLHIYILHCSQLVFWDSILQKISGHHNEACELSLAAHKLPHKFVVVHLFTPFAASGTLSKMYRRAEFTTQQKIR